MTKIGGKCQSKNSKWDILSDFQTMCFCVTVQNEWNMWFRIFIKKITPLSHFSHSSWQVCGHFDPYYIHRVASHRQVTKKGRRRTTSTATFLIFLSCWVGFVHSVTNSWRHSIMSICCGPGYASPREAFLKGETEKLLYIPCIIPGKDRPDYLSTVDIDPASPTFCKVWYF